MGFDLLQIRAIIHQHDNWDFGHVTSFVGSSNSAPPASISS
jgi:hypothetical protein